MAEEKSWEVVQGEIEAQSRQWTEEFEKSKEYKKLSEEAAIWVYPVLHGFSSIAQGERGKSIEEWDADTITWVLLEGMPREFVVDVEALKHTVEIMGAFFEYGLREKMMTHKEVVPRLKEIAPLAHRRMIDPTLWKPHKSVIIEALQEEIDLNDRKAMEKFYKRYQARRTGNFIDTVLAEKTPGRNEPCSCGSGKKYKKCCGAAH
jgi:Uncharacterized protein conserved in bacteria